MRAAPVRAISGTARRSAQPAALGPSSTITVAATPSSATQARWLAGPPATRDMAEAAIRLLKAIQAKLVA